MTTYYQWSEITTMVFAAVAFYFLFLLETETIYVTKRTRFLSLITGGLFLVCLMTSILAPILFSPRVAARGRVTNFYEVGGRGAHFEFTIEGDEGAGRVLRAFYFDKGFYFQDPAVSDGDVIAARWVDWTNRVIEIRVLEGKHSGWSYKESEKILFPSLGLLFGLILILRAIGVALGRSSTPLGPPRQITANKSDSVLGL